MQENNKVSSVDEIIQDFKELNIYLDHLSTQKEKDAGNLWIQFSDKFRHFQNKIVAKWQSTQQPSISVDEDAERYANNEGYPQSDKEYFETTSWTQHNIAANGFKSGYKAAGNKAYTLQDIKDALRNGVNIGMKNVEQPRYEGDFNFNQQQSIEDCKQYLKQLSVIK